MGNDFTLKQSTNVLFASYSEKWHRTNNPSPLIDQVMEIAKSFEGDWAFFDDVRNWPIKVPEHISLCANSVDKLIPMGLTHCVVCAGGVAITEWMMKKIIPDEVNLVFFETLPECEKWLIEQGFNTKLIEQ